MDYNLDTLGKRIYFCQNKIGGSGKLQKAASISQSQLNRLIKSRVDNPGINTLMSIANACGVSFIWLITGKDVEVKTDDSYIEISFYEENGRVPVLFDKKLLTEVLKVQPEQCSFVTMKGDSMSPVINNGDQVLIDRKAVTGDGVFLIRIDSELMVKRVQRIPGIGLEIISDNKSYKSYQLPPEKVEIIGRKIWVGGRG